MAPSIPDRLAGVAAQWRAPLPLDQSLPLVLPEGTALNSHVGSLDRKSWKVLGVIAGFAIVVVSWFWIQGQPQQATSIPIAPIPSASAGNTSANAMGTVIVHVTGQVRKPGLQQLPAGSRVADAIQAAGGVTKTQAQDSVNLARVLIDGEQIVVGAGLSQINSSGGGQGTGKVSLNSANQLQLESLPGVGPSLAQRIMEYRSSHGGFRSVEELDDVAGIGSATLNRLRPLVSM
jgi:competence protein ComEA